MVDRFNSQEQRWADEFARFKKDVLDRLENIDYDNFSPNAKKLIAESAKGRAGFEAFADDTSSVARMFAEYDKALAKVEAIANNSGASIVQFSQRVSDLESSYSQIETSATNAAASASLAASYASQAASSVASISERVDANGAFISLMASASNGRLKVDENGKPIVNSDGSYTYIDAEGYERPIGVDNIAGIYLEAINNGVAGQLTTVKLAADVIKFGDYASVDEKGWLKITRLWDSQSKENYYAKLYSQEGDFGIYHKDAGDNANPLSSDCMWGVYNSIDGITFSTRGNQYLVRSADNKMMPKGVWDFSKCDVENIPLYFS